MSTKIRLARFGRKKKPFYRIVVADSRSPRDGRHLEMIGYYDPTKNPAAVKIDKDKAFAWLNKGAIPTQTVRNLLSENGILLEWDLRKSGKPENVIHEELQKFGLLRDQKTIRLREAEDADREKKQAVEEEPAVDGKPDTKADYVETISEKPVKVSEEAPAEAGDSEQEQAESVKETESETGAVEAAAENHAVEAEADQKISEEDTATEDTGTEEENQMDNQQTSNVEKSGE